MMNNTWTEILTMLEINLLHISAKTLLTINSLIEPFEKPLAQIKKF